ncbi:alkaline phosphatase [Desmospora profundinema]|uniref:Alkaline phosphatase n=1 Tax=Desmospora profundinema TaxID=1571184 RepID=A0ABU1IKH7_9BACL|nr:alkaline phosphatase [Desmospora profundinema]MDR6225290.1 alkaline phosphatase [Desmospora profundinema]
MKKRSILKGIAIGLACTVALGSALYTYNVEAMKPQPTDKAKNVILLIGDGMGPTQVSAAAYLKGRGYGDGKLAMNRFKHVGLVTTYSHDNVVTDSAAAATAFSSGRKTDNNVVGKAPKNKKHVDGEKHFDVTTVLDDAKKAQKATGLVTTTRLTHATPAAFAAHAEHRNMENEIAEQVLNKNVDVLLGGGKDHFLPTEEGGKRKDGKNLISKAQQKGYSLIEDKNGLERTHSPKLLGLFNNSHMKYELDRSTSKEPSLAEMTKKALQTVSKNKNGFFLMVEGGRIDHAGHANYPATTIQETLAFDQAVQEALHFAQKNPDTLVVVSADHETGGMSIGLNGEYAFHKDVIRKVKRSSEYIGEQLTKDRSNVKEVMAKYAGISDLTVDEEKRIQTERNPASAIAEVISHRAKIGWTTTGHTAVHVPVYAYGPGADKLTGTIDNTDIAKVISKAIK